MSLHAGPAGPVQTNGHNDTGARGAPITLPELRQLLGAVSLLCAHAAAVEGAVREAIPRADSRIARNRLRSERSRRPVGASTNGRQADVRLVLTNNGLIAECRRCGREVKS